MKRMSSGVMMGMEMGVLEAVTRPVKTASAWLKASAGVCGPTQEQA